jgi:hypothetical protein
MEFWTFPDMEAILAKDRKFMLYSRGWKWSLIPRVGEGDLGIRSGTSGVGIIVNGGDELR